MNKRRIAALTKKLLRELGDNPEREGLKETPERVAKFYAEVFEGMAYTNAEIAAKFGKCFLQEEDGQTVTVDGITVFSFCEHHLALMYDMKVRIRYVPHGKVLGLSKFARIAQMCAKRLQLQERLGADIAECITLATGSPDVEVAIEGKHSCMTARGIRDYDAVTRTVCALGIFKARPTGA